MQQKINDDNNLNIEDNLVLMVSLLLPVPQKY
jgi:hypothetical protein